MSKRLTELQGEDLRNRKMRLKTAKALDKTFLREPLSATNEIVAIARLSFSLTEKIVRALQN